MSTEQGSGPIHPHVPNFLRGFIVALMAGIVISLLWPYFVKKTPPDPARVPEFIEAGDYISAEAAIDGLLNQANQLLDQGEDSRAEALLARARDLSHDAKTRVLAKREKKLISNLPDQDSAKSRAKAALLLAKKKPEYSFSFREAEACYLLAGIMYRRLQHKYAAQFANHGMQRFVPPTTETDPIRNEILRGLAANPDHKKLYRLQGVLDNMTGRFSSAEKALLKAIELDDKFAEAYNDLGLVYINRLQFDKAQAAFEKALLAGTGQKQVMAAAHYNLGMYHTNMYLYFHKQGQTGKNKGDLDTADKHRTQALKNLRDFMKEAEKGSADSKLAEQMLNKLAK